jgi:serine phosphatase RsbU (regulator of sigma subunit)/anti-anti-sigma regulatory factor
MSSGRTDPGQVVLVVDDDPVVRRLAMRALEVVTPAYHLLEAEDGLAAQSILTSCAVDVVVTDLVMPNVDGLSLMEWARARRLHPVWVILSGVGTLDSAVDAIRHGAFDFIAKPFQLKELEIAVRNAAEHRRLRRDRERLTGELRDSNAALHQKVREAESMCRLLEEQRASSERDLARAQVIQRALLPSRPVSIPGFSVHAVHRPGGHVGGDLYDVIRIDRSRTAIYVADAAGHGITAAMLSVVFKQCLSSAERRIDAPSEVMEHANRELTATLDAPGLFLTVAYAVLDSDRSELVIASAGHTPVLVQRSAGRFTWIVPTGPPLGLDAGASFGAERVSLDSDDRVLLFTDGIVQDARDPEATREAVRSVVARTELDGKATLEKILGVTRPDGDATGDVDDTTLLLLETRVTGSSFDNGSSGRKRRATAIQSAPASCVSVGSRGDDTFVALTGRCKWVDGEAFESAVERGAEGGSGALTLDLSRCEYLDSTWLGLIHDLVTRRALGRTRLQGVQPSVRVLFEELSMTAVLDRIDAGVVPLPEPMEPVVGGVSADPARGILRAHELLASLSETSRERFLAVVEDLRDELRGP